jgi:hypothetical protein
MSRADHIYQARVYLAQARATPHHSFRALLQNWAAKRRQQAAALSVCSTPKIILPLGQLSLF